MGIPVGISGIRETTPYNLIIDAGKIWVNILLSALRGSSESPYGDAVENALSLGATRGGQTSNLNKESRQIDANGLRLPVKGLERIPSMRPTLTLNLLEHDSESMQRNLGAADLESHTSFDEITPRLTVDEGDYFDNIAFAGTISGSEDPIIIVYENVLAVSSNEITFEDDNEAAMQVEFVAHAPITDPLAVPVHYFIPQNLGS